MPYEIDDRPGADFTPCREPGHAFDCPHGAGGDHELEPHGEPPWYHSDDGHGAPYATCPVCALHDIHMDEEPRLRPDSCEPCQALAERQQGEDTDR